MKSAKYFKSNVQIECLEIVCMWETYNISVKRYIYDAIFSLTENFQAISREKMYQKMIPENNLFMIHIYIQIRKES